MDKKIFYVCSYGGCGSKMLCKYLSNFGEVKHIHSRNPPNKLEYIYDNKYKLTEFNYRNLICDNNYNDYKYNEWFNNIEIPKNELNNYYVIYIYKNPVKSIYSRFKNIKHLTHIQVNNKINKNIMYHKVINKEFAEIFKNNLKQIKMTSDMFIHK